MPGIIITMLRQNDSRAGQAVADKKSKIEYEFPRFPYSTGGSFPESFGGALARRPRYAR